MPPTESALLAHIISQTRSNLDFLVSQNFITQSDVSTINDKLATLSRSDTGALVEATQSLSLNTALDPRGPSRSLSNSPLGKFTARRRIPLPREQTPLFKVLALWDYNSADPSDLNFKAGDVIEVTEKTNVDWWTGRLSGRQALFPSNYVERIVESSSPAARPVPMPASTSPLPVPEPQSYQSHNRMHSNDRVTSPVPAYSNVPPPDHVHQWVPVPPQGAYYQQPPPPPGPGQWASPEKQPYGTYSAPPQPPPEAPPTQAPPKKNKFGGLGTTMATSAASGVGFGAGAAIGSGIIDAIF